MTQFPDKRVFWGDQLVRSKSIDTAHKTVKNMSADQKNKLRRKLLCKRDALDRTSMSTPSERVDLLRN